VGGSYAAMPPFKPSRTIRTRQPLMNTRHNDPLPLLNNPLNLHNSPTFPPRHLRPAHTRDFLQLTPTLEMTLQTPTLDINAARPRTPNEQLVDQTSDYFRRRRDVLLGQSRAIDRTYRGCLEYLGDTARAEEMSWRSTPVQGRVGGGKGGTRREFGRDRGRAVDRRDRSGVLE
jgi:hypothetical protein